MPTFRNDSPLTQVFKFHGVDEMPRTLKPGEEIKDVEPAQVKHLPWLVQIDPPVEA